MHENPGCSLQVEFGPVIVSNTSIKSKLLVAQRDLVTRLLKLLQTAPKDSMVAITKRYKELQVRFQQTNRSVLSLKAIVQVPQYFHAFCVDRAQSASGPTILYYSCQS
jgi:hypothetical protein